MDEFTGRIMDGRRLWGEGLHQAIEAKEGVENTAGKRDTLASVTFQNYFRLYNKLAGMTGTAADRSRGIPRDLRPGRGRSAYQTNRSPA